MKQLSVSVLVVVFGLFNSLLSQTPESKPTWDGSQAVPVHLLPLKDEFNQQVIPTESFPLPFSSRHSCAPCHDYAQIAKGLHFNPLGLSPSGRPGEPWFWVEEKSGTVLPLAYRGRKGIWDPGELGLSSWDFALLFGRHMTGGGSLEPSDEEMSPESRWNVSGRIEINCLGCHSGSRIQSHSEWAKQILRHNFRWAATAAAGLGEVGGMASRLPATWDLYDGPNPDDTEWAVVPSVRYNPGLFDSKHRVFFDIAEKPDDRRCLVCHSVTPASMSRMELDADIHSASGLHCVDCHRNGLDHAMNRGYEGETGSSEREIESLSCTGCHLGPETKGRRDLQAGRLGAPYPKHRGLPPVHLDRLSCTVCHSGPIPGKEPVRVRTSRANRLGIYGVAQWMTETPYVFEPVYIREEHGKISPHRLVWPSYWAALRNGEVVPIGPDDILELAGPVLGSEEWIAKLLLALFQVQDLEGTPVMVFEGRVFELNVDDGLDVSAPEEAPISPGLVWAVKIENEFVPLIPEFDFEAELLDLDTEARIYAVFDALAAFENAPGKPVLVVKNVLYHTVEGYLEKMEYSGESQPRPQLNWLVGDQITPLVEDFDLRTVLATAGDKPALTEEQIVRVLGVLESNRKNLENEKEEGYVYISGGKMFELDKEGRLASFDHESANPVAWPLGHRVRPAQQSLGVNGCRDCHRANSSFFFGKIKGKGPLITENVTARSQSAFMGLVQPYQRLFGLSFSIRPVFKAVLFLAALLLGALLLVLIVHVIGRSAGLVDRGR